MIGSGVPSFSGGSCRFTVVQLSSGYRCGRGGPPASLIGRAVPQYGRVDKVRLLVVVVDPTIADLVATVARYEGWDAFTGLIPEDERGDLIAAYNKRLTGDDPAVQLAAAKAWSTWEGLTVTLLPNPKMLEEFTEDSHAIPIAP